MSELELKRQHYGFEFQLQLHCELLYCGQNKMRTNTADAAKIVVVMPLWRPQKPLYCGHSLKLC